jgi:hypothetical protein
MPNPDKINDPIYISVSDGLMVSSQGDANWDSDQRTRIVPSDPNRETLILCPGLSQVPMILYAGDRNGSLGIITADVDYIDALNRKFSTPCYVFRYKDNPVFATCEWWVYALFELGRGSVISVVCCDGRNR